MRINIVIFILLITFSLSAVSPVAAQKQVQPPQTIEEAQEFGFQILTALPNALKEVWETQALPVWANMWNWTKNIWDTQIFPWVHELWEQLLGIFGKEIEQRRPFIEQEFEREKQQLKQEIEEKIPGDRKTLWDLLKGFFQKNEES